MHVHTEKATTMASCSQLWKASHMHGQHGHAARSVEREEKAAASKLKVEGQPCSQVGGGEDSINSTGPEKFSENQDGAVYTVHSIVEFWKWGLACSFSMHMA